MKKGVTRPELKIDCRKESVTTFECLELIYFEEGFGRLQQVAGHVDSCPFSSRGGSRMDQLRVGGLQMPSDAF